MMIPIAHAGPADSQAAVEHAATLMPDRPATVLTAWEPLADAMARSGMETVGRPAQETPGEAGAAGEHGARGRAGQAADLARRPGLHAQARVGMRDPRVAATILVTAGDIEAEAIVPPARGLSGLRSRPATRRQAGNGRPLR